MAVHPTAVIDPVACVDETAEAPGRWLERSADRGSRSTRWHPTTHPTTYSSVFIPVTTTPSWRSGASRARKRPTTWSGRLCFSPEPAQPSSRGRVSSSTAARTSSDRTQRRFARPTAVAIRLAIGRDRTATSSVSTLTTWPFATDLAPATQTSLTLRGPAT